MLAINPSQNILQYQVLNTSMSWGEIFTCTEALKVTYTDVIEDYSVSETALEEVFLAFARRQYPDRGANLGCCKKVITLKWC
jgi:hypothetical protein